MLDCELLRKVYINLIGEKEPTLTFQESVNEKILLESGKIKINKYSKEIVEASKVEVQKHKEFLKKELKKNYF